VLLPRGSPAQLVLGKSSGGGALGSANLVLDLQSVTINGKACTGASSESQQTSNRGIGKNKRTAEMVGAGAALGTLIGAVAGGPEAVKVPSSALVGARGGATAAVLTQGKEVKVPGESGLQFRLTDTLHFEAAG
jgi:hypothetical protein